jgi:uncharacterized protein YqjF (DUF2071 family)
MTEINRIAPPRPEGKPQGYQKWRQLLFVHWAVPIEAIRPLVPPALELDLWEDTLYVGVVPFSMETVRPRWAPEAVAFNFLETNLRTYVACKGKPGVFFLSLEAASWIAVQAARKGWGLPYYHADMSLERDGDTVRYETTRKDNPSARHSVQYEIGEPLGASQPGTLEHFLLERYYLFVDAGKTIDCGQVHHAPYPAQRARIISIEDGLIEAAGLPAPKGPPPLAHYAEGVDVEVFELAPFA